MKILTKNEAKNFSEISVNLRIYAWVDLEKRWNMPESFQIATVVKPDTCVQNELQTTANISMEKLIKNFANAYHSSQLLGTYF